MLKKIKPVYTEIIHNINLRMKDLNFKVDTELDIEEKTFQITNTNLSTGDIIYRKISKYREDHQRESLILRVYQEYLLDMIQYGIIMNNESYILTNEK